MRKLAPKKRDLSVDSDNFFSEEAISKHQRDKEKIINHYYLEFNTSRQDTYYNVIRDILNKIGFNNVKVTRSGDTNVRMDAIIIDSKNTIPIEIKSPTEIEYINIKAVSQALENKIILQSRKFHPSNMSITSLAIAHNFPNDRSEVKDLMDFYYNSFNVKIGCVDFKTLLSILFDIEVLQKKYDLDLIIYLKGFLNA